MTTRTLLVLAPLIAGVVVVSGDEARHGRTVLRLRPGDAVRLADGAGRCGVGEIVSAERDELHVRVDAVETMAPSPAFQVTVACAVPKGDKFDYLVRQLTELGVGTILPLQCERGERMPTNLDRARRIAAEALKQCRRSHVPIIGPVTDIQQLCASSRKLILLDPQGSAAHPGQPAPVTLVVGPEGGLTTTEIQTLLAAKAISVRLASSILRIETAAVAATAVWVSAWEGSQHD